MGFASLYPSYGADIANHPVPNARTTALAASNVDVKRAGLDAATKAKHLYRNA
jgi:hypothetical protein